MKIKRVSDATSRSFKMRLCHVSDTHGGFPRLFGRYDAVLHTGDFFPNSQWVRVGDKVKEAEYQLQWLKDNISNLKQQLQGHPYFFILGNHDFVSPEKVEEVLLDTGVLAFNLTDKFVLYNGVTFYGFPYIPAIGGNHWNYEREIPEMQVEVDKMVGVLNLNQIDVLACHAPISNCLDLSLSNQVLGSGVIAHALNYKIKTEMLPKYYCHGHIHEANGLTTRNGILISNAATTFHIIEVG